MVVVIAAMAARVESRGSPVGAAEIKLTKHSLGNLFPRLPVATVPAPLECIAERGRRLTDRWSRRALIFEILFHSKLRRPRSPSPAAP